jgi:hypothetical protein
MLGALNELMRDLIPTMDFSRCSYGLLSNLDNSNMRVGNKPVVVSRGTINE